MAKIKNVAIQMDHVSGINIAGDSTFAMSLEAQARGYRLFHYTPNASPCAMARSTRPSNRWNCAISRATIFAWSRSGSISTMDVIHLRGDPPFDMAYITSTHLLERIHPKTLVVNDPARVRNSPERFSSPNSPI